MIRQGTIYKEPHNHGRKSGGSQDGNRISIRRIRGVGVQKVFGYRWVGEITVHGKRYRCRSCDYNRVEAWLNDMKAKFSPIPYYTEEGRRTASENGKQQVWRILQKK